MNPPVIAIVGRTNAGKTTLMERLVAHLTRSGLRVATVKHSHHQPEMDQPGKDSWRHKQAGATASFLIGPERMLMVRDLDEPPTPEAVATRYCADFDLVLAEGYAALSGARIEVVRAARSREPRCPETELLALITDVDGLYPTLPRFGLTDIPGIADFILRWIETA